MSIEFIARFLQEMRKSYAFEWATSFTLLNGWPLDNSKVFGYGLFKINDLMLSVGIEDQTYNNRIIIDLMIVKNFEINPLFIK